MHSDINFITGGGGGGKKIINIPNYTSDIILITIFGLIPNLT